MLSKRIKTAKKAIDKNVSYKVVKNKVVSLLKFMDKLDMPDLEPHAVALIKALKHKNLAALYNALTRLEEEVAIWDEETLQEILKSSNGAPKGECLPFRYTHLTALVDTSEWRTTPPKVKEVTLFVVNNALIVGLIPYGQKFSIFSKKYKTQRIGGDFLFVHKILVAVCPIELPFESLCLLTESKFGKHIIGNGNVEGETRFALAVDSIFKSYTFKNFAADFRHAKKVY